MRLTSDEIQRRFAEKKVVLLSEYKSSGDKVECLCFCGKKFLTQPSKIFNGHTKSCGCYASSRGVLREDLTNHKFGKLTVLQLDHIQKPKSIVFWLCKCDCGNLTKVSSGTLKSGHTSSCGCGMYQYRKGDANYLWTGCGDISGKRWASIKSMARLRGIDFSMEIQEAWQIFVNQDSKCTLSGSQIWFDDDGSGTASLDRIDNTVGYVRGNVQWVHKKINEMKFDLTVSEFISWCRLVVSPCHGKPSQHCKIRHKVPHNWSGFGNISGKLWWRIKRNAKNRHIPVAIDIKDLWYLFLKQSGRCAVTGVALCLYPEYAITASLDRINRELCYTIENVQWVHSTINCALRKDFSFEEMLGWAELVVNHASDKSND